VARAPDCLTSLRFQIERGEASDRHDPCFLQSFADLHSPLVVQPYPIKANFLLGSKRNSSCGRDSLFSIAVDFPSFREHNPLESPLQRGRSSFGSVIMYYPLLRGRTVLAGKKVLLIDRCQATCQVRAAVLRSHGVKVHAAEEISAALSLWQPNIYDLVMLDVRRYSSGETLEFYEQIKQASPRERVVFLVGPPTYLSLTWPGEVIAEDASSGQWGETVKRFLAAA